MRRDGRWRLLDSSGAPVDGPGNMAIDAALLDAVKAGGAPVVRLYRWSPATLSFGRNQPARDRYDREAAADRGIAFVRRPTGGQAVLHDDELTYAVVAPVSVIGKPRAAYGRINRALVDGLVRLGVRAAVAGAGGLGSGSGIGGRGSGFVAEDAGSTAGQSSSSGHDWDAACFRRPERGEVVVGGAKLVGSAQRMEDRVILQHGSILVGGSQAAAEELLVTGRAVKSGPSSTGRPSPAATPLPESQCDPGWTTLEREMEARPSLEELAAAIRAGFERALGIAFDDDRLTSGELEAVASLEDRYRSEAWTWRR